MALKVCPTAEDLESPSEFYCSEAACSFVKFKNMANLEMHRVKHHKLLPTVSEGWYGLVNHLHIHTHISSHPSLLTGPVRKTGFPLPHTELSLPPDHWRWPQLQFPQVLEATLPEGARQQEFPVLRVREEVLHIDVEGRSRKDLWQLRVS